MPEASASYIGEICMFGFSFAPRDWYFCNGAVISIGQETALFSLLGTQFGGDGRVTFGLPNMNSRAPVGASLSGIAPGLVPYGMGNMDGSPTRTLGTANIPTHTHTATFTPAGGGAATGTFTVKSGGAGSSTPSTGDFISGGSGVTIYGTGGGIGVTDVEISGLTVSGGSSGGTVTVDTAGSGNSFSIQSPITAVGFAICSTGIYPPRN